MHYLCVKLIHAFLDIGINLRVVRYRRGQHVIVNENALLGIWTRVDTINVGADYVEDTF